MENPTEPIIFPTAGEVAKNVAFTACDSMVAITINTPACMLRNPYLTGDLRQTSVFSPAAMPNFAISSIYIIASLIVLILLL